MAKPSPRGASKSQESERNGWSGLVLLGFVLGVTCTLGVQYLLNSSEPAIGPSRDLAGDEGGSERSFEFYTLLNDMQVQVPQSDILLAEDDNIIYWLQVASFRNAEDAEELRVSLILQNMQAEVRPVSNNGVLWHRVVAGPFATRTLVNRAKSILIEKGMQPMTQRQELD